MLVKFSTEDGWRYFDGVQQVQTIKPGQALHGAPIDGAPGYALTSSMGGKLVYLLTTAEGWVAVQYDRDAYLCTDRGETINAI